VYKPSDRPAFLESLRTELQDHLGWNRLGREEMLQLLRDSERRPVIHVRRRPGGPAAETETVALRRIGPGEYRLELPAGQAADAAVEQAMARLAAEPLLVGAQAGAVRAAVAETARRPFFLLFVFLFFATALLVVFLRERLQAGAATGRRSIPWIVVAAMLGSIWLLPGLTLFARVLCSCIYITILSIFRMDLADTTRFRDHFRFLLMIFLYSGFWVLYFQMFDSVLWYVKAYVDASPLDGLVNSALAALGVSWRWRFDVEHVTVINAGTIIALQLLVSKLFEKRAALPTMITGIVLGTAGFAILAISPHIWVFVLGNIVFSVGEMTAHPKFFSYVGQIAPRAHVAMYMGYLSLYGVIGSSIAGVLGANLYVRIVDRMNQPRLLWLIFAAIGAATVVGLLLYNRFLNPHRDKPAAGESA
jgi:dipeptide/tripeptide permease